MEDAEIVYILDISCLEIKGEAEFLGQKVKRVKSFCLSFCDWRYVLTAGQVKKTGEPTAGVLNNYSFWRCSVRRSMEKNWSGSVGLYRIAVPEDGQL